MCVLFRNVAEKRTNRKSTLTVTMSLVTTHVSMATNATWLFFVVGFYQQHGTHLSSGHSYSPAGVISCITEQIAQVSVSCVSYPGSAPPPA